MREHSAGTALLTRGLVGDCGLAFRLNTFPCFLLLVPQVEDQMGHLSFGKVKFLLGMAFPRFWGSFDGSGWFLADWLLGGFPSSARLMVGTCGGNKVHLEPAGGISPE